MHWFLNFILVFSIILLLDVHAGSGSDKRPRDVGSKYSIQLPELLIFPEHTYQLKVNERTEIEIPSEWLVPKKEFIEDKIHYVSSFNYLRDVDWFEVGGHLAGLHFSSYKSMPPGSGSAMAASGRDVF